MDLSDKIYIGKLIDIYGGLLTQKQLLATANYYLQDLSLSEIAENEGISRQGAYDLVTKSRQQLEKFEEIVGMSNFKEKVSTLLSGLLSKAQSEKEKQKINEIISKLE